MESVEQVGPDAVEVMPGIIPSMIAELKEQTKLPIVTGGLLKRPEEMKTALEHGASAVSTSNPDLWQRAFATAAIPNQEQEGKA